MTGACQSLVGIASEISAGTEPDPPVQDVYNLINDRCWLPDASSTCAGRGSRSIELRSTGRLRRVVMHSRIFTPLTAAFQDQSDRSQWVAFQLHTVCEVGGLRATTIKGQRHDELLM